MGVLNGKHDLLDRLTAYRVRPALQDPPGKFETGTGSFEGMVRGARIERRHGAREAGTTRPVHQNTLEEIRRFGEVLGKIAVDTR